MTFSSTSLQREEDEEGISDNTKVFRVDEVHTFVEIKKIISNHPIWLGIRRKKVMNE